MTGSNKITKRVWLNDKETLAISQALSGEAKLIFQLMASTGLRSTGLFETKWLSFNHKLCTLQVKGNNTIIPVATSDALLELRESAESEDQMIFSHTYKMVWDKVSRTYFRLGIEQSPGCLKKAKWTFARRHWLTYKNKTHLAKAMGLTTARCIPKIVFNTPGPGRCMFQF